MIIIAFVFFSPDLATRESQSGDNVSSIASLTQNLVSSTQDWLHLQLRDPVKLSLDSASITSVVLQMQ